MDYFSRRINQPMRIAILIKEFENLSNWELRIINEIKNNPRLELSLLIQDGRVGDQNQNSLKNKIRRFVSSGNFWGKLLFKIQGLVEEKLFKEIKTVDKEKTITFLQTIDTIKVSPKRKGFLDIFNDSDADRIAAYKPDIILRHEFNIIRGPILTRSAKYGIWSFHHADNSINRGGPVGFWEIVLRQEAIGVTLQQLTPELDGGLVIDKAFFNIHRSFLKTSTLAFEGSVSLLFKNIEKLLRGEYSPTKSMVYSNPLYRAPNVRYTLNYMWQFYGYSFLKLKNLALYKFLGTREDCWTLFIGKGNFLDATLFRLKPVKLPKDEFWADPFLFEYENQDYVFFENYSYTTKRGKISCGKIEKGQVVNVELVLDLDYHLSYPFIFKEAGEIYLMPETEENKRLEIYRCIDFPTKWELVTTAFEGEMVVDAHFYDDENNKKWLFLNKKVDKATVPENELFIYQVDSIRLNRLIPHSQNPILIDARTARNGGAIFRYGNAVYRPSQRNIDARYGKALNINKIKKLTIDDYVEEHVMTVEPNFHKGLDLMHHLHQTENGFVIDAAYKRK